MTLSKCVRTRSPHLCAFRDVWPVFMVYLYVGILLADVSTRVPLRTKRGRRTEHVRQQGLYCFHHRFRTELVDDEDGPRGDAIVDASSL